MILKVNNVNKDFNQGDLKVSALKDINISASKNESISIIGPSGSGKTTLLSLLAGLDQPTSGQIIINEQDICKYSEKELTRFRSQNIGIVFQQFHLMQHLTALENVMLPLEISGQSNILTRATEMLTKVGLAERLKHFPHQLSGGENQRVAIARALVTGPTILLADEPSGNLDTETGDIVMNLLFDLVAKSNSTLVLITHDLQLANRCDRKINIMGGMIQ